VSVTVCIAADTIGYPEGGGHLWPYLNWALGFRSLGCRVLWLEQISLRQQSEKLRANIATLRGRLARVGLGESLVLCLPNDVPVPAEAGSGFLPLAAAVDADLLWNMRYGLDAHIVSRFGLSAMLDIDPGLLQLWMKDATVRPAPHELHFTIGETIGRPGSRCGDAGLRWLHTRPCVALDWWEAAATPPRAPFSTVTHWSGEDWNTDTDGRDYCDTKRAGFAPFLALPGQVNHPMELAVCLGDQEDDERAELIRLGWSLRNSKEVAGTPWDYQRYIQNSLAEFSCAKPSYVRLQTAWVSDRTICYLASGKPAVVQHTGPSGYVPDAHGLFRFRDPADALTSLRRVIDNYPTESRNARAIAEEHFDAKRIARDVLTRAIPI
jgi:hypothetical protein